MTASRMGKDLQCTKACVSPEAAYQRWELMHVYLHLHCFTNDICGTTYDKGGQVHLPLGRQSRSNIQQSLVEGIQLNEHF